MAVTTVGRILLKQNTPKALHSLIDGQILDKKGLNNLFSKMVETSPEEYGEITSKLSHIGFEVATRQGTSVTLEDLVSPIDSKKLYKEFEDFQEKVHKTDDSEAIKNQRIFDKYNTLMSGVNKHILEDGLKNNKSLAKIIMAGARGSTDQYRSTIATQGVVVDANGTPRLDMPVKSSFAEGLSLPEYLMTSFGTRSSEILKKVGVAQGGFMCLSKNSLVRMADGSVKLITDIVVGDWVLGADRNQNTFPVRVTAIFDNGRREVNRYTFRSLNSPTRTRSLDCTPEHKILCKNTTETFLRTCGDIEKKANRHSRESAAEPKNIPELGNIYDNRALFLGLMLGDGCWSKGAGTDITFSCGDPSLIEEITPYFETLNYQFKNNKGIVNGGYTHYLKVCQLEKKITINGKNYTGHKILNWLKDIQLLGTDSYSKFIPEECKTWNKKALSELLGGLFSTDGCFRLINKRRSGSLQIELTMCAEKVVKSVLDILENRFGVVCTYREGVSKHYDKIYGKTYTVSITNAEMLARFLDNIPIYGVKKQMVEQFREKLKTLKCYAPFSLIGVESLGEIDTHDLEVDHPDHLFVLANGLIVSNSKQFSRSLMNLQVTEHDCGTTTGISVPTTDKDSVGAFFAQPAGGYKRNNEVTAKALNDLKEKGIPNIVIRSPMTCKASNNSHFGAVCQLCVGRREKGLAAPDSYVGLVAGTAVAEPLTDYAMKFRSQGGASSKLGGPTGFKIFNQLANIPKTFLGKNPVVHKDGIVTSVHPAAAGGHFIKVGDMEYYLDVGQTPHVKEGDHVEQGDVLGTGLIDPSEVVQYKGIGEGRKYYANALKKAFDEGGLGVNRRNFELIARAAVDHVKINDNDGLGDFLPDQVVSYNALEKTYVPRPSSKEVRSDLAFGKYLEKPVLHYTIGSRVSSSMIKELKEHNEEHVLVNDNPPNFEPHMVRLLDVPEHVDDFMHVLYSTNLARRFGNAVNEGAVSDIRGPSPIPGLAVGVGFGEHSNWHEGA